MSNIKVGIDIGSTTIKVIVIDDASNIIYSNYKRHYADIKKHLFSILDEVENIIGNEKVKIKVTGSGSMNIAKLLEKNT